MGNVQSHTQNEGCQFVLPHPEETNSAHECWKGVYQVVWITRSPALPANVVLLASIVYAGFPVAPFRIKRDAMQRALILVTGPLAAYTASQHACQRMRSCSDGLQACYVQLACPVATHTLLQQTHQHQASTTVGGSPPMHMRGRTSTNLDEYR